LERVTASEDKIAHMLQTAFLSGFHFRKKMRKGNMIKWQKRMILPSNRGSQQVSTKLSICAAFLFGLHIGNKIRKGNMLK
jgi:hypothetical protein